MLQSARCGSMHGVSASCSNHHGYWNYAQHFIYNAAGAVTAMQLGNGRWESTVFNSRLQPTQIALGVTPAATNLLKLDYEYGATAAVNNGNVTKQTITVPTVCQSPGFTAVQDYTYDSLNRLKSATENITPSGGSQSMSWQQTFEFDRYGNRNFVEANTNFAGFEKLCESDTALCEELRKVLNPDVNQSDNRLSSSDGYVFDASGNTTRDPLLRKFTYDAENKQVKVESVDSGGTVTGTIGEYVYDGDGKRIKKIVPSPISPFTDEVTVFVYDAGGKLMAVYATVISHDPKVSYTTADHLGSPRLLTDENGATLSRRDFHPFGEEILTTHRHPDLGYTPDDVRQKFTGYERDKETDLDFAQARYLANHLGRFISADPLMMEVSRLGDPQAINLYIYTRNNPLRYVDPDGEKFKGTDGEEVELKREKVNGKKIWVIKSDNASDDLKKMVELVNDSGSRTASNMLKKLNKHDTMINLVIDTETSITDREIQRGSITIGLHQPHDKNGPIEFNEDTDKFEGRADASQSNPTAYREATITLFSKKMQELGYSGESLDARVVSVFGHEARHDLDPKQARAGITGTGSNEIWHPERNGKPKRRSPEYFEQKILRQIERKKGITVN